MASSAPPRRAYVSFSGGGAKGIVHVGGLKAVEVAAPPDWTPPAVGSTTYLDVRGYSGTSAGAMVAALAAAGYSTTEMIDPAKRETILEVVRHGIQPHRVLGALGTLQPSVPGQVTDLFGADGWRMMQLLRWLPVAMLVIAIVIALGTVRFVGPELLGWSTQGLLGIGSKVIVATLAALAVLSVGLVLWSAIGFVAFDTLRRQFDIALRLKVRPGAPLEGGPVTFFELRRVREVELKIVASDILHQRLKLFSADATPDVAVADAVAASACFPVLFRPRRLSSGDREADAHAVYVDGGLVSNLPAWVFDEERALDRDAIVIAFDIQDRTARKRTSLTGFAVIVGMVRTAIFGSGMLNTRGVNGLTSIDLDTDVGLLDFDMGFKRAGREINEAYVTAERALARRFVSIPDAFKDAARVVHDEALHAGFKGKVRVAMARPARGTHHSLSLVQEFNFDGHPDKGLTVPIKRSIAGSAYLSGEVVYEVVDPATGKFSTDYDFGTERYAALMNSVWRDLKWVLAIPLADSDRRRFVVILDGDVQLPENASTNDILQKIVELVQETYDKIDFGEKDANR
jgi:NTE family protein